MFPAYFLIVNFLLQTVSGEGPHSMSHTGFLADKANEAVTEWVLR